MTTILLIFIMIILTMMIMKISIFLSKKKINLEKMSPFECGFNPFYSARLPFSMRFFLITIIFLIFDIEIALLLPMIYTFNFSNLSIWLISSIMFMLIILMGLFHEWNQGALNWM